MKPQKKGLGNPTARPIYEELSPEVAARIYEYNEPSGCVLVIVVLGGIVALLVKAII